MDNRDLRRAGLKVTVPRLRILEVLESVGPRHMTVEDIYQALLAAGLEIGLATIYRVLTQFEEAGLVTRHHFEGGQSVFELNEGQHHDHIVCVRCGRVDEFMDPRIEALQRTIASEAGYQITDHQLHIYGVCPHCRD
ncbi:MAG TPA: ferric iron uptake transcriptional regulator [Gammaproteobacteria bacterium]